MESDYQDKRKIYMPNEIFADLAANEKFTVSSHRALTYSYYFYITFLYRYAVYGMATSKIDQKRIKEGIGYHKTNKKIDYVIKKDGLLEQMGYVESSTDYPTKVIKEEMWNSERGGRYVVDFEMISENREIHKWGNNFRIKVPAKGLYRTEESREDNVLDGTFYDISNTHCMSIEAFRRMIADKELGVDGFYLYGYLKYKCKTIIKSKNYIGKYSTTVENIAKGIGLKEDKIYDLNKRLVGEGFIRIEKDRIGSKNAPNKYEIVEEELLQNPNG